MNDDISVARMSALQGVAADDLTVDRPVERGRSLTLVAVQRVCLGLILVVSAFLNFFDLSRLGYGNTYYAAGVKSMLMSWHNFFFVSFDPGGFVTIDKPPLGFWIQAASAEVFGFHGWSLILPEALAGIGSVALVYYLVRPSFGDLAALLAAAFMAVMPVAVASNRSNIVDSLLVFTLLLGAWALMLAVETGKLRWLLLAMVLVGLGFNIKMLEAYLVVPAFVAIYFLGANARWRTRIWHLAIAGVVLLVVSLSWATAVDLTPASQRPYVGSSDDNSEYNLIFGYNGLNRLLTGSWSFLGLHGRGFGRGVAGPPPSSRNNAARFGFSQGENGTPGPLRLINQQLGGQAGWLLPLALIGILAAGWQVRPRFPLDDRHRAILFWGVWLLTGAVFFSIAGFFHSYYLVMLGPPIAVLGGAALAWMWHDYRGTSWRGWLLPFALVGVALVQRHLLRYYTSWHPWVSNAILDAAIAVAILLFLLRASRIVSVRFSRIKFDGFALRGGIALMTAGVLAIGVAPSAWAMETTLHDVGGLLPSAGPAGYGGFRGGRGGFPIVGGSGFDIPGLPSGVAPGDFSGQLDSLTIEYLLKNQGNTKYLVATLNANSAAPIILATGEPVMALGGFTGSDPILTVSQLQQLIADGTVRFFLVQGGFGGRGGFAASPSAQNGDFGGFEGRSGAGRLGQPGVPGAAGEIPRGEFVLPGAIARMSSGGAQQASNQAIAAQTRVPGASLLSWVASNCTPVSPTAINGTQRNVIRGTGLYDCKP